MYYLKLFIIIIFSFNLSAQDSQPADAVEEKVPKEKIDLVLGLKKIKKLDFDPDTRIIVDSSIINYQIVPAQRELILTGKKAGPTNMIIKDKFGRTRLEYEITVTVNENSRVVQALRELIGDIEGIEIGIKADRVIIDGEIVVPKDIGRLIVALEQERFKDVIVFVEPSPHTMKIISKKMQDEIQKQGMNDVTVRVVNDTFWLEGIVNDRNNKKIRSQEIAKAYLPDRLESLAQRRGAFGNGNQRKVFIKNFIQENEKAQDRPLPKLIKVTAQFVELAKDYARSFGFRWSPTFSGGGGSITVGRANSGDLTTASENTLTAVINNLFPKLASAKNAGNARIMQSGMIVVEDGVEANISKSSQVPFSTGSGEFTKSDTATAQFSLKVKPQIIKQDKVKLGSLNVKISVITGQTSEGDPTTTQNDVNTELIVNSGESGVVGGVFQSQSSNAFDKLPPSNDDTDFLFNFVRSKEYNTSKSQYVVFVTPEIIESATKDVEEIKRKFRRRRR